MFLRNKDNSNIDVCYNNKNEEHHGLKFKPTGRRRRFGTKGTPERRPKDQRRPKDPGASFRTPLGKRKEVDTTKTISPEVSKKRKSTEEPLTNQKKRAVRTALNFETDGDTQGDTFSRVRGLVGTRFKDEQILKIKKKRAIIKEVTEICGLLEEEFIDYFLTIENNKVV